MPCRVKAQRRKEWTGRRRSGFFFSSSDWTLLSDEQITPEILADPVLIVERIAEAEPETETPASSEPLGPGPAECSEPETLVEATEAEPEEVPAADPVSSEPPASESPVPSKRKR